MLLIRHHGESITEVSTVMHYKTVNFQATGHQTHLKTVFYRVKIAHTVAFCAIFIIVSMYWPTNRIGTKEHFFTFYRTKIGTLVLTLSKLISVQ